MCDNALFEQSEQSGNCSIGFGWDLALAEENKRPSVKSLPDNFADPDAVRKWLHDVCAALEISPSALAQISHVAHTTINRFMSGNSLNKNISGSTINSILSALRVMEKEGRITLIKEPANEVEIEELKSKYKRLRRKYPYSRRGYWVGTMLLHGFVGHEVRFDFDYRPDPNFIIKFPLRDIMFQREIKGYEVREEGNIVYNSGDILACTEFHVFEALTGLQDGPRLKGGLRFVRVYSADGVVTSDIYTLEMGINSNWWLIPTWKSAHEAQQLFIGKEFPMDSTHILMVVVASIRGELF